MTFPRGNDLLSDRTVVSLLSFIHPLFALLRLFIGYLSSIDRGWERSRGDWWESKEETEFCTFCKMASSKGTAQIKQQRSADIGLSLRVEWATLKIEASWRCVIWPLMSSWWSKCSKSRISSVLVLMPVSVVKSRQAKSGCRPEALLVSIQAMIATC